MRWVDLAFLALGSMLPDIIDKPLGILVFGTAEQGRTFGHPPVPDGPGNIGYLFEEHQAGIGFSRGSSSFSAGLHVEISGYSIVATARKHFSGPGSWSLRLYSNSALRSEKPYGLGPRDAGAIVFIFFAFESRNVIAARWRNLIGMGQDKAGMVRRQV